MDALVTKRKFNLLVAALVAALLTGQATAAQAADLHRADFRVEGSSCAACLRRVAKKLHAAPGVIKADVSIFRPYWGLVIYDAETTTTAKVFDAAKDEHVKMVELEDVKIAAVPTIVIPKTGPAKTAALDANIPPGLQGGRSSSATPAAGQFGLAKPEPGKTPVAQGK